MDLNTLFEDKRVQQKTHIVMKSVGVEAGAQYKGYSIAPRLDAENNPEHRIFPAKNQKRMEAQGWVRVNKVVEPTDAKPKKAKPTDNVEG